MSRDKNRARFPTIATFLDGMRERFGAQVKVLYAKEGEHETGDAALEAEVTAIFADGPNIFSTGDT